MMKVVILIIIDDWKVLHPLCWIKVINYDLEKKQCIFQYYFTGKNCSLSLCQIDFILIFSFNNCQWAHFNIRHVQPRLSIYKNELCTQLIAQFSATHRFAVVLFWGFLMVWRAFWFFFCVTIVCWSLFLPSLLLIFFFSCFLGHIVVNHL